MNIGLIDIDSHNFPNLAMMKISAYHKALGDTVEWWIGLKHYDRVYQSKVFTGEYSPDIDYCIQADEIVKGGTGYGIDNKLPKEIEHMSPDYSLYPKYREAYGFLTRGCPRNCQFCIVTQKEGKISKQVDDLDGWYRGQRTIKLLDPNLLACRDHEKLLQQLVQSGAWVDFTQGLDARCITQDNASLIAKVKTKMVHFALDGMEQEASVRRGLEIYKKITGAEERTARVYILTNYETTHEEDMYRVKLVQSLGYWPYVMIYDKPHAPQITRDLQRWSNNPFIYFAEKNFENYNKKKG